MSHVSSVLLALAFSAELLVQDRKLGLLLPTLPARDVLMVTEISRLGRSLMDVMRYLHSLMEREVTASTIKAGSTLGNTLNSTVVAVAFSRSAEIARAMLAHRTKAALARKRSAGKRLGRPTGARSQTTKLTGNAGVINDRLAKRVEVSATTRILGVHRCTGANSSRRRGV